MIKIFQDLPSVTDLISGVKTEDELIKKFQALYKDDKKGFTAYKMVRYILATNRSLIRKLHGP
jgi:hypothetical protein